MNHIADTLARLRREKGLSQEQIAQQLHVTRQTVSSWETGRTVPGAEMLAPLAQALGAPLSDLLGGEPAPAPPSGKAGRLVRGLALLVCAVYVCLMGFYAWTLIYTHQLLLKVVSGAAEYDSVRHSLEAWQQYGSLAAGIAVRLAPAAALICLLAAAVGRLPFRRRTLYLGALAATLAAALAILPFWLQSGWPPVNYYLEWFLTACGLLCLFLLDAGVRLAVRLIRKHAATGSS